MPKFPEPPPPEELERIAPDVVSLAVDTRLWRVYFRGGPHPVTWNAFRAYGPTKNRFDHHAPPARRRVLYTAALVPTCIAEFFQETRTIDRARREPWLVGFRLVRPVTLLSLRGNWPTRAGASMAINSGLKARARRWSRAIHSAFPHVEGLLYCSSMDANEPAIAMYERAESALAHAPDLNKPLSDPDLRPVLEQAALQFGYFLL